MFDLNLILPATVLGISRLSDIPGNLCLLFSKNTNDKASVFAGSIFSLAALSGYDTVVHRRDELGLQGDVFLVSSRIAYQQPALSDLFTRSETVDDLVLTRRANHKMSVRVKVFSQVDGKRCASFEGVYVMKSPSPGSAVQI
jgi:thioesterase domain-containing protein